MRASPLVLGGRQRDTMQHPLTGATCVALPNVGMCPQLSCALTFMYLQQVRRASSLGGCFLGLGGLGTRVAGMRFGTLDGFREGDPAFGREGWIGAPSSLWILDTSRPAGFAPPWIL